jgi:peptidoglycan-N-acetylglucosamine deacetylase
MDLHKVPPEQPVVSLSLDLDNQWSYMRTHGNPGWESFPSFLDIVVPRILSFLQERCLTITIFIVGQDAALAKNRAALAAIAAAGHEIGNHSFHHEPWLHLYSAQQIEHEITHAEEHIGRVTGQQPRGFRGPGYSLTPATLRVLARRGYFYDASTLPTFLGPLAKAYYFRTSSLRPEEKQQRQALFGTLGDGFRPIRPYWWLEDQSRLLEIPVTTMPLFKLPIHFSYLLYLSGFAPSVARQYFQAALKLCQWTGTQPSILLHSLDFLGYDDVPSLAFFPAMKLPSEKKLALISEVLAALSRRYVVLTLQQHARKVAQDPHLACRAIAS